MKSAALKVFEHSRSPLQKDLPRLVDLPKIHDHRGNLTFVQQDVGVPFDMQRVYYLYDVPAEAERGGHAHLELQQLIVALSGSFDVVLDNGKTRESVRLFKPYEGLYVPRYFWRELENFSAGAVCLVIASEKYSESDYIRDYDQFVKKMAEEN